MGNSLFALALVEEADHGVVVEEVGNQVVNEAVRLDRVHLGGSSSGSFDKNFQFSGLESWLSAKVRCNFEIPFDFDQI